MTFEEMQKKFLIQDQDQYDWYYVGMSKAVSFQEVAEIVSTFESEKTFVHKARTMFFVGVDQGYVIPADTFEYIESIDPPVAPEPVVEEGV